VPIPRAGRGHSAARDAVRWHGLLVGRGKRRARGLSGHPTPGRQRTGSRIPPRPASCALPARLTSKRCHTQSHARQKQRFQRNASAATNSRPSRVRNCRPAGDCSASQISNSCSAGATVGSALGQGYSGFGPSRSSAGAKSSTRWLFGHAARLPQFNAPSIDQPGGKREGSCRSWSNW